MITAAVRAANRQRESIGKTQRECPICASLHLEYEFLVDRSPVCGCQTCGLLFLNPAPESAAAQEDALSPPSQKFSKLHEANAEERLNDLLTYADIRTGKILLVGGDEYLAGKARQQGLETVSLSLEELEACVAAKQLTPIDLCILYCSLERMQDPLSALQFIRSILSGSGALMVVSPTTDSRAAKVFRSSWWEFNRRNRFYFSVDTLQSLLIKAGFGDPMIIPDRALISIDYLRQNAAKRSIRMRNQAVLRGIAAVSPFLRSRTFRILHGRTRFLVKPKLVKPVPLLSVIVPVYNEKATFVQMIEPLLEKSIEGLDMEVIIVESNSTDGTREQVQRYADHPRVTLLLEDKPRGKGHAVRTGLNAAKGDIILFQDADLEYDLNDYDALLSSILRFESNFVLGSRHNAGKNSWKIRTFNDSAGLSSFFNMGHLIFLTLVNVLYNQRLTDPFTMFKVFRRDCISGLSFECNRFDFDFEIVIKLLRKGYKPLELPVNYDSRSLSEGKKVNMFRDPFTWLRALVKFRRSPLYGSKRTDAARP